MSKWRSITDCYKAIKEEDPETSLALGTLRELVRYGEIPSKRIGRKYFLRLEDVESWLLDGGTFDREEARAAYIRANG